MRNANQALQNALVSQNEFRSAALQKVNEVMGSLKLPKGQKLELPFTRSQMQALAPYEQVKIKQIGDSIVVRPPVNQTQTIKLTANQQQQVFQQALQFHSAKQPQGQLVNGTVNSQGLLTFQYQNQQYQLTPKTALPAGSVNVLVKHQADKLSVTILPTPSKTANLEQFAPDNANQNIGISSGRLVWQGKSLQLPAPFNNLTGQFLVKAESGQIRISKPGSNQIIAQLPTSQLKSIEVSANNQTINQLIPAQSNANSAAPSKLVSLIGDTIKLGNNELQIKLLSDTSSKGDKGDRGDKGKLSVASTVLNQQQLSITQVMKGQLDRVSLPISDLFKQNPNQQSSISNQFLMQLVKTSNGSNLLQQLLSSIGVQVNKGFEQEPKINKDGSLQLSKLVEKDIQIKLPPEQLDKLIKSNVLSPTSPTANSSSASGVSVEALLSNLTQSPNLNTTQLKQLSQLIKQIQPQPVLNEALQMIEQEIKNSPPETQNKPALQSLTAVLGQIKSQINPQDIQQLVQSQLQMPNMGQRLGNDNTMVGHLAQALQLILGSKVSNKNQGRSQTASNTNAISNAANKTNTLTQPSQTNLAKPSANQPQNSAPAVNLASSNASSKRATLENQSKPTKVDAIVGKSGQPQQNLEKAAVNATKHFQLNQLKSAQNIAQNHNEVFISVPIKLENDIQTVKVSIQIEESEDQDQPNGITKLLKFSLKFDTPTIGKVLFKAALANYELKLNIYAEQNSALKQSKDNLQWIRERLNEYQITLTETQFKQGKIPEQLWTESALGMHYRA